MRRKEKADDRLRLNAGFIYAAIYNTAMGEPGRRAVQPTDIVPSMREPEFPELDKMTGEQRKAYMFRMFMGSGKKSMP